MKRLLSCINPKKFLLDYQAIVVKSKEAEEESLNAIASSLSTIPILKEKLIEAEKYKSLILSISDTVMDMVWAKDLNGKYIYANQRIKDELLFDSSPIGKTDLQLATARQLIVGEDGHNFGRVCGNSDLKVLELGRPAKFLEYGTVTKQDGSRYVMYLEVHKNLLRDQKTNEIIGVCGVGRDITLYYTKIKEAAENLAMEFNCKDSDGYKALLAALDQFKFENPNFSGQ